MRWETRIQARMAVAALLASVACNSSHAMEGGASFYILGSKVSLSGVVPGPGLYFQNDVYLYSGSTSADAALPFGGQVIANVDALLIFEAPTVLAVTPWEIFGGRFALGATLPLGYADINARINVGPFSRSVEDDVFTVGDPVGSALIGWEAGNLHWSLGTSVNFPVGDYREGEIANVALHRWAADVTGAVTWLDPKLGWDLSAALGFTFNGKNRYTDYGSGNELHFEAGITKIFSRSFSAGIGGYYNRQITGDDGPLGDFKGEVVALGAHASYTFEVGARPVTATVKYFHEFDATNRLEGDAAFFSISTPLWVAGHGE